MTSAALRSGARCGVGLAVLALALSSAGCTLPRSTLLPAADGGAMDTGQAGFDAGDVDAAADAGTPSDGCVRSPESCNAADDDCDGRVDEDFGVDTDVANCGACGNVCPTGPHGTATCNSGSCDLRCEAGWDDCDPSTAGCESSLSLPATCGGCSVACSGATPLCAADTTGVFACASACGIGTELCGASCVDTQTSASHCGGCATVCAAPAGTVASCASGRCATACADGLGDCDGDGTGSDANGCETSLRTLTHCGTCGTACAFAGATASCASGTCTFVSCDPTVGDCNSSLTDGCERDLRTVSDCGGCGLACTIARGVGSCSTGTCAIASCNGGFGDCDGRASTGCELSTEADPLHCGSCTTVCAAGQTCAAGTCGLRGYVEVGTGIDFSCALHVDGRVFCWGANASGQLGDGTTTARRTAAAVMGLTDAIDLDVGDAHACAIRRSGALVCWGENARKQIGDAGGTATDHPSPVPSGGITDAVQVSAGGEHTCVVRRGGAVACFGRNDRSQLGTGGGDRAISMNVPTITAAIGVAAGNKHTCALVTGGGIFCWGEASQGQLGNGSASESMTPQRVGTIADATAIASSVNFTCAVRGAAGNLSCWGDNASGQLGDGTTMDRSSPVSVGTFFGAIDLAVGDQHACVRTATGSFCWGSDANGRLGTGGMGSSSDPAAVTGLTDAIDVAAGAIQSCAVRPSGVVCWGGNGAGQLGDGTTMDRSTFVPVMGLP